MIAGIDEAGRGPLAGPVVAAAVVLDARQPIAGLDDSKKLSPKRRALLAATIRSSSQAFAIAWADRAEIDSLNILHATMLAMRRAILNLPSMPDRVLVDGNRLPDLRFQGTELDGEAIVGGDARIAAISAASILAKVTRDNMMMAAERHFPGYGFARHKGYGTPLHLERIARLGPCGEHRRSFRPMRQA